MLDQLHFYSMQFDLESHRLLECVLWSFHSDENGTKGDFHFWYVRCEVVNITLDAEEFSSKIEDSWAVIRFGTI